MIIAVNTRLLIKDKLDGIGWFAYETLKRITKENKQHKFVFIFDRKYDQQFIFSDNIEPVIAPPQARHPLLFMYWFEYSIPQILRKYRADLFLSPDGYLSLNTKVRSLPVIHDLNFEHYPGMLPWSVRIYYKYFFPKFSKKAVRIATVSEYSKTDIAKTYNIDPVKIDVVHNGANESYKPNKEIENIEIRNKYASGKPFFVVVGSIHPRKNITNILHAFELFRKSVNQEFKILFVGDIFWWTREMQNAMDSGTYPDDIVFTGRLSNNSLSKVLAASKALILASYFEGFGIPIIEAMQCDIPVITSNVTSMPEVAGDAAVFVDPTSVESIKKAMTLVSNDQHLVERLIKAGRKQRANFSWELTSSKLNHSIMKALEEPC